MTTKKSIVATAVASGKMLKVNVNGGNVMIYDAEITSTGIAASNGAVLPAAAELPAATKNQGRQRSKRSLRRALASQTNGH